MIVTAQRSFGRNFNRRGEPNYRPPGKRPAQNLDDDGDSMRQVDKMLGIVDSYEHLLPKMKTQRDLDQIFGQIDPLQVDAEDVRKQHVQRITRIQNEIQEMLEEPESSVTQLVRLLHEHNVAMMNNDSTFFTNPQKAQVGQVVIALLDAHKLHSDQVGLVLRFADELFHDNVPDVEIELMLTQALRLVYSNMQNVPMADIAFSLQYLELLDEDRKIRRFLTRLLDTIEMTNPALLQKVYNQDALLVILVFFKRLSFGSMLFREKVATILQSMVTSGRWVELESSSDIADMLSCLRDIDPIKFQPLMDKLLEEWRSRVNAANCTSKDLVRIYLSFMSMYRRAQIGEEDAKLLSQFTSEIIEYWVVKGFDSDELVALGSRKSVEFLIQVAQKAPKLEKVMFEVHIRAYLSSLTQLAFKKPAETSPLYRLRKVSLKQVTRLSLALSRMECFAQSKGMDPELSKLIEQFKKAEGSLQRGGALSDLDDEDSDWESQQGDPLDHFDDSDFDLDEDVYEEEKTQENGYGDGDDGSLRGR